MAWNVWQDIGFPPLFRLKNNPCINYIFKFVEYRLHFIKVINIWFSIDTPAIWKYIYFKQYAAGPSECNTNMNLVYDSRPVWKCNNSLFQENFSIENIGTSSVWVMDFFTLNSSSNIGVAVYDSSAITSSVKSTCSLKLLSESSLQRWSHSSFLDSLVCALSFLLIAYLASAGVHGKYLVLLLPGAFHIQVLILKINKSK